MARRRKLTKEQHKLLAERNRLYWAHRLEAAKHSIPTMAREFGVTESTVRVYLEKRLG
jgi:hypothetical protein